MIASEEIEKRNSKISIMIAVADFREDYSGGIACNSLYLGTVAVAADEPEPEP